MQVCIRLSLSLSLSQHTHKTMAFSWNFFESFSLLVLSIVLIWFTLFRVYEFIWVSVCVFVCQSMGMGVWHCRFHITFPL